jgi:hypothetical protein
MKYPLILIIPVLMLLDYFLTVAGMRQYQRQYGQHIRLEQYELNPLWQKSIEQNRWFNRRHLFIVLFITIIVVGLSNGTGAPDRDRFLFGALVTIYLYIIGRHLSNILNFRYIAHNPQQLRGEVVISYRATLKSSQFQVLPALLPLLLAALVVNSYFLFGSVAGLLLFTAVHWIWLWRYQKSQKN